MFSPGHFLAYGHKFAQRTNVFTDEKGCSPYGNKLLPMRNGITFLICSGRKIVRAQKGYHHMVLTINVKYDRNSGNLQILVQNLWWLKLSSLLHFFFVFRLLYFLHQHCGDN